jgi:hypothetical protein
MFKHPGSFVIICMLAVAARAAEPSFLGSWKLTNSLAELTLKGDGTGILKSEDPGKATPFTWVKTSQGATISFNPAAASAFGTTNLFIHIGPRNELVVKDSREQTTWRRDDGQTRRAIEQLLQLSGVDSYFAQQNAMQMASLRASKTDVPEETWKKLEQQMDIREAREELIAIYEIHYNLDELKALNNFYASPVGKKELTTHPSMIQHMHRILQQRADQIASTAARESSPQKK